MFKGKFRNGLFRKAADTATPNPYLNGRRAWNNANGSVLSANQLLSVLTILCLLITLAAVGGMVRIGSLSKFIPIAFLQDTQGNVLSVTRGDQIQSAGLEDYRAKAVQFIEDIRLVTPDVGLQRKAIFRLYAGMMPNDPATAKANEYLNPSADATPFARARKEVVSIEVKTALLQNADTQAWQIEWEETVRDRQGVLLKPPYMMKAIVSVYQAEPTKDTSLDDALKNPKFLFTRDFNWNRDLAKAPQ